MIKKEFRFFLEKKVNNTNKMISFNLKKNNITTIKNFYFLFSYIIINKKK